VLIGLVNVALYFQRRYWPAKPETESQGAVAGGAGVTVSGDGMAMTQDLGCPTMIDQSVQTTGKGEKT